MHARLPPPPPYSLRAVLVFGFLLCAPLASRAGPATPALWSAGAPREWRSAARDARLARRGSRAASAGPREPSSRSKPRTSTADRAAATIPPAPTAQRPIVAEVILQLPAGEDRAALQRLVSVRPGQPLARSALRRTVQLLFGLGRFSDVVARTAPAGPAGRVVLTIECIPRQVIAAVRVVRADRPRRAFADDRVRRAAGLAVGDELWPGSLDEATERLRAAYARHGWRAASVRARAVGRREVTVELQVDEGAPTRVLSLSFGREPGISPERLSEGLAMRPGAVLDLDLLDEDVRTVRARLRKEGFLRARGGAPAVTFEAEGARIEIPVESGPRVEFRFSGQASFDAPALQAQLGLDAEQILDEPALEAAAGKLRAFYRARGFAEATVTVAEAQRPGKVEVDFQIDEGRRYRVGTVRFPGTAQRGEAWLRERLDEALEAQREPAPSGPREDAALLLAAVGSPAAAPPPVGDADPREVWDSRAWDAAGERIAEQCRAEGYLDAAYEGTRVTLDARAGTADVEIRLREGVRTAIEAVAFEGNASVPAPELSAEARLSPGDPLSRGAVDRARDALLALYASRGRLYARVLESEDLSSDRSRATVRFRIEEGPEVRVGNVVVGGARRTREDVVRESLALHPGDVFDPDAAARTHASLMRLGVFRSVGVRLVDPEVPQPVKDVTVELAERPWRTLAPGVGFSLANGPRAFIELTQPNLLGRALELSARAKANYIIPELRREQNDASGQPRYKNTLDRLELRGNLGLNYQGLRLLGLPLGARFETIAELLHRSAYDLSRGSALLGLDLPATSRITLSLQYELEIDDIRKGSADILTRADVERLRFPEGVTTLHSIRPGLAIDFRDSTVNPHSGWVATGTAEFVRSLGSGRGALFGLLRGSDVFTEMVKLSGGLSAYFPITRTSVLALAIRAGRIMPLDRDSQTIGPKRFFLGGATTMRGYGEDEMLPEDYRAMLVAQLPDCAASLPGCSEAARQAAAGQTPPSEGGESFALAKAELRIPLRESVEVGLFADMGNLWLDPLRERLTDLRLNVGFGLRVLTPIGPAVLDFGFNPSRDTRVGEAAWAPHFSIGLF
jgi:outer membrane protein insertion porin family